VLKITFFILLILMTQTIAYAEATAGSDIAILGTGVGARALAMGGAYTAVADNADAPYWNPAGLSNVKQNEISIMYIPLSSDADYYYISYARPLWSGTMGASLIRAGTGTLPQASSEDDLQGITTFGYSSTGYMLSYGFNVNPNISFGLTAKYLMSDMFQITGGESYGYSLTPGILMTMPVAGNQFALIGAKLDDILNQQFWGTGTAEQVPSKLRIGLAYRTANLGLFAVDVSQITKAGYGADASFGYEWIRDWFALRLGYTDSILTSGIGLNLGILQLDYAHVPQSSITRNVHRVSVSARI
jgi:long-subunit fatty acid transport protein